MTAACQRFWFSGKNQSCRRTMLPLTGMSGVIDSTSRCFTSRRMSLPRRFAADPVHNSELLADKPVFAHDAALRDLRCPCLDDDAEELVRVRACVDRKRRIKVRGLERDLRHRARPRDGDRLSGRGSSARLAGRRRDRRHDARQSDHEQHGRDRGLPCPKARSRASRPIPCPRGHSPALVPLCRSLAADPTTCLLSLVAAVGGVAASQKGMSHRGALRPPFAGAGQT